MNAVSNPLLSHELRLCAGILTYNHHNAIRESQVHSDTILTSFVHNFPPCTQLVVFQRRSPCENINLFNSKKYSKRRVAGIVVKVFTLAVEFLPQSLENPPTKSHRDTNTALTSHQFYTFFHHITKISRHLKHTSEWSERES